MTFRSILTGGAGGPPAPETAEPPACFLDLNLDQVVDAVTRGKEEYDLKPFFRVPLRTEDDVRYRHEVMQDLDQEALFSCILAFAASMKKLRAFRAQEEKLHYVLQKERWFLDAVEVYLDAVRDLHSDLSAIELKSRGLLAFRRYLDEHTASEEFRGLCARTAKLNGDLGRVSYCFLVKGTTVRVRKFDSEADYSAEVAGVFEKFRQGAANDYRVKSIDVPGMNHVEEDVLAQVAKLYPEVFSELEDYRASHAGYLDERIGRFDREIQFYVSYRQFMERFTRAGLSFCYPAVSAASREVFAQDAFDLALAVRLVPEQEPVICNDFRLGGQERIIVVSGPNQGGKTTFARMFGQAHWLGSLGCPIPGKAAQVRLFDRLFTHFERAETMENLRGKLQDELTRMHEILDRATENSIVILNEIFSSTTVADAVFLGRRMMERIIERDLIGVCVTFLDELASIGEQTVSMVSTVVPENPAQRTFKVVRRPADGLSYAVWIAEKYRLTYPLLKERVRG